MSAVATWKFTHGQPVFVSDDIRGFVPAIVAEDVLVRGDDAKARVKITYAEDAQPMDPTKTLFEATQIQWRLEETQEATPEMDQLKTCNVATVLDNVGMLFTMQQAARPGDGINTIYSSVGPVLIAMNPFTRLPLYGPDWIAAYRHNGADGHDGLGPHAYRTAEEAYQSLGRCQSQALVLCGESGSGKTFTNRKMLEYLCEVAKPTGRGKVSADPQNITMTNELLEAFGNATTLRNDNSSRFGKLTNLQFGRDGLVDYVVEGCGVKHYLLERSRIVGAPDTERNYHIFYQLLRSDVAPKYKLMQNPESYEYTKNGASLPQPGIYSEGDEVNDDAADFKGVVQRLDKAGFDAASRETIFECFAAVLHLGNTPLTGNKDQSTIDASSPPFVEACTLLGVKPADLSMALTTRVISVGSAEQVVPVGLDSAKANRDTVAKMVYSNVFDAVVHKLDEHMTSRSGGGAFIRLLDIFGFEDMNSNGFEQMYINLTNESIQHLFNQIIFARELDVYRQDGIEELDFLNGPTNYECVKLFLGADEVPKTPGIIGCLSTQCKSLFDDDQTDGAAFVNYLNRVFANHAYYRPCSPMELSKVLKAKFKGNGALSKKMAMDVKYEECFLVKHYAGEILYTVNHFVPKSKDFLHPHMGKAMRTSVKQHVRDLFPEGAEGKETVGDKFKKQLLELTTMLKAGDTRFVRCIKSNQAKVPGIVDRHSVLEQLIRGGVVAALEMRANGLPERLSQKEFVSEFSLFELRAGEVGDSRDSKPTTLSLLRATERQRAETILSFWCGTDMEGKGKHGKQEWKTGNEMVFMKAHVMVFLYSLKRFFINRYARSLKQKLKKFRVRKVDRAWETLLAAEQLAEERGLMSSAFVHDALIQARDRMKPVHDALMRARGKHGSDTKSQDKVMAEMKPYEEAINHLSEVAYRASAAVEMIVQRKAFVDNLYAQKLNKVLIETVGFIDAIKEAEQDAAECADIAEPAEIEQLQQACKAARVSIEAMRKETIPRLKAKGPPAVNLEAGLTMDDIKGKGLPMASTRSVANTTAPSMRMKPPMSSSGSPPTSSMRLPSVRLVRMLSTRSVHMASKQVGAPGPWQSEVDASQCCAELDSLLGAIREQVETAKSLCVEVLKVRKAFQQVVAELDPRIEAAQAKLEELQLSAQRCMQAGLQEPLRKMHAAVELDDLLAALQRAAKEPERFREAVAAFESAVAEAVGAVSAGEGQLRRCEEEAMKRRVLRSTLNNVVQHIDATIIEVVGPRPGDAARAGERTLERLNSVRTLQEECGNLMREEDACLLAAWEERIAAAEEQASKILEELRTDALLDSQQKRLAFQNKVALFGATRQNAAPDQARAPSAQTQPKVEDLENPKAYMERNGLQEHEPLLRHYAQALAALKDNGVRRSDAKWFFDHAYPTYDPKAQKPSA